jgi:hypothetical protein
MPSNPNPYHGINAHLNSLLQQAYGGWESFHHDHITDLRRAISRALPPGYSARSEKTVQILGLDDSFITSRYPDVGVFREADTPRLASPAPSWTPTLETDLSELQEQSHLFAVKVYNPQGRLVTRVELLSPGNKEKPSHYLAMRLEMLQSHVHMVEIDYLHEQPNLFGGRLPDYSRDDPDSYPYHIAISNVQSGRLAWFCWGIDQALPTLALPLDEGVPILLDWDAVYQLTVANDDVARTQLDYSEWPINISTYHPEDQARIKAVMERAR